MMHDDAVLLVHDVVNDFMDDTDSALFAALANIRTLLAAARAAALPVVFAAPGPGVPTIGPPITKPPGERLVWGTAGVDVPASIGVLPGDTIVRKPRFGAFFGSAFGDYLRQVERDTVIVCGLSLAGGVETTVRDAYNRDLRSIIVADACLCRAVSDQGWGSLTAEEVAKVTLSVLAQRFARIASTAEIRDELRSRSGAR
jgi:ureidoacrylate peracid hydrolase